MSYRNICLPLLYSAHIQLAVFIHLHTILIEALDCIDLALKKLSDTGFVLVLVGGGGILQDVLLLVRQNYANEEMAWCFGLL